MIADDEWLGEVRRRASEHPLTQPIEHFLIRRRFPVDIRHNSKIFREQLAVWAEAKLQARIRDSQQ